MLIGEVRLDCEPPGEIQLADANGKTEVLASFDTMSGNEVEEGGKVKSNVSSSNTLLK